MARVKCIMMQRDESTLLEPWLRYNGYLFGFENLLVFDNSSMLTSVTETLAFYEKLGVEVVRTTSSRADWFNKGGHVENIVRHWQHEGRTDVILPLHCDEFPAVFTPDGISCRRGDVHDRLEAIGPTGRVLETTLALDNVPGRPGWFTFRAGAKHFLAGGDVASVDFHNRAIRTTDDAPPLPTDLVYLHHRHRPLDEQRRLACQKLGIDPIPTPLEALRRHADPVVRAYACTLASEAAQRKGFDSLAQVEVADFSRLLHGLGVADGALAADPGRSGSAGTTLRLPGAPPAILEPAVYRALHPDVAACGTPALKHYLLYGHAEGRALAEPQPQPQPQPQPVVEAVNPVPVPTSAPARTLPAAIGAPPKPTRRPVAGPASSDVQRGVLAGRARAVAEASGKNLKADRVA